MRKLSDEGINTQNLTEGNNKTKCPKCQPPHKMSDNPLSVTIEDNTAKWKCHHCEWSGGIGENTMTNFSRTIRYEKPKLPTNMEQKDFVAEYFSKRGISKKILDKFRIYNENKWIALPYIDTDNEIVNVKYRTTQKEFRQTAKAKKIIYNYNNVHDQETVIWVEGEIDVLSLAQVGYLNATTLSDGAPQSISKDQKDTRFQGMVNSPIQAEKVIMFCDADDAGNALKESILYRVGKDKAWFVDLKKYENCKDANDVLVKHGEDALKDCIENAIPYPVDGLYRVSDYENEVMDLYEGRYVKPIDIGMGPLDQIMKIQKSTFHLWSGIPNHGKSLMLSHILLKLAENHGWRFAIFSPEHSTAMHIRRILQIYVGKGFDEDMYDRMTKEELERGMRFIDQHFYFIETKDAVPSIDLIMKISKSFVYKYGSAAQGLGIVIDPYNEVDPSRSGGKREDEHIRDFISECKKFARLHNAVVWCVAHPTKLPKEQDGSFSPPSSYQISGSSHWANMADVIAVVHRDFDDNTSTIYTRKIREQDLYGKIGEAKFQYNFRKYCFEPFNEDKYYDFN